EIGVVLDERIEVDEIAAPPVIERGGHVIDTGFLRLNHGFGLGTVGGGTRPPRAVDDLEVNAGICFFEHGFELVNAGQGLARHRVNGILIGFAKEYDFDDTGRRSLGGFDYDGLLYYGGLWYGDGLRHGNSLRDDDGLDDGCRGRGGRCCYGRGALDDDEG